MKARTLIPALLITFAASGCATWDNLSSREKSAATGAAVGMVAGTASGTSNAAYAGAEAQRRYDIAYQQCMYAKGNQLPGSGYGYRQPAAPAAAGPYHYPPPPPPR